MAGRDTEERDRIILELFDSGKSREEICYRSETCLDVVDKVLRLSGRVKSEVFWKDEIKRTGALTIQAWAEKNGVPRRTAYALAKRGELKIIKMGKTNVIAK